MSLQVKLVGTLSRNNKTNRIVFNDEDGEVYELVHEDKISSVEKELVSYLNRKAKIEVYGSQTTGNWFVYSKIQEVK